MLEDKLLVWKLKGGNIDTMRLVYEKYKDDLLALAVSLSNDRATAEDALHDVFVSFAQFAGKLKLRTSLKSYLSSCIANRIRNLQSSISRQTEQLNNTENCQQDCSQPSKLAISAEQSEQIETALSQLPYQQREVIILHVHSQMRFKAIARLQGVSINTIQSRYRYGLEKLRIQLNGKV
jgi:RNA polymerase sigma-70 factor (ECF subfamily)